MATYTVRTTYALDVATVERLEALAKGWGLSRSAALRKLVREAGPPVDQHSRMEAWQRLKGTLTNAEADAWIREIRTERLASDPRTRAKARR